MLQKTKGDRILPTEYARLRTLILNTDFVIYILIPYPSTVCSHWMQHQVFLCVQSIAFPKAPVQHGPS